MAPGHSKLAHAPTRQLGQPILMHPSSGKQQEIESQFRSTWAHSGKSSPQGVRVFEVAVPPQVRWSPLDDQNRR
jgi:hypothetical protein